MDFNTTITIFNCFRRLRLVKTSDSCDGSVSSSADGGRRGAGSGAWWEPCVGWQSFLLVVHQHMFLSLFLSLLLICCPATKPTTVIRFYKPNSNNKQPNRFTFCIAQSNLVELNNLKNTCSRFTSPIGQLVWLAKSSASASCKYTGCL